MRQPRLGAEHGNGFQFRSQKESGGWSLQHEESAANLAAPSRIYRPAPPPRPPPLGLPPRSFPPAAPHFR